MAATGGQEAQGDSGPSGATGRWSHGLVRSASLSARATAGLPSRAMPRLPFHTALAASALLAAAGAQADVVKLVRGAPIVARLWDAGADEVTFNVYRTAIRKVTH